MIYVAYIFNFTKVQLYIVYIDTYTQTQEEQTKSIDYGFEFKLMGISVLNCSFIFS